MTTSIVISRYDENLEWINNLSTKANLFVYNKGSQFQIPENIKNGNFINLPNVGRESHTWVYHIYKNYENLSDNIIFLQGRIDDLGCMAYQDISKYIKGLEKELFCASRLGLLTPFHWNNDNLSIPWDKRYKTSWDQGKISKNQLGFREFSKQLFPNISLFVPTSYGGCFSVRKEAVQQYQKNFYLKLLNFLDKYEHPIEAHYLERLWCYMFSKNSLIYKSILDVFKTKIERNLLNKF